ncbi:MAG: hypothetical protein V1672_03105 [Candidatus Diapherotrites archaeon]
MKFYNSRYFKFSVIFIFLLSISLYSFAEGEVEVCIDHFECSANGDSLIQTLVDCSEVSTPCAYGCRDAVGNEVARCKIDEDFISAICVSDETFGVCLWKSTMLDKPRRCGNTDFPMPPWSEISGKCGGSSNIKCCINLTPETPTTPTETPDETPAPEPFVGPPAPEVEKATTIYSKSCDTLCDTFKPATTGKYTCNNGYSSNYCIGSTATDICAEGTAGLCHCRLSPDYYQSEIANCSVFLNRITPSGFNQNLADDTEPVVGSANNLFMERASEYVRENFPTNLFLATVSEPNSVLAPLSENELQYYELTKGNPLRPRFFINNNDLPETGIVLFWQVLGGGDNLTLEETNNLDCFTSENEMSNTWIFAPAGETIVPGQNLYMLETNRAYMTAGVNMDILRDADYKFVKYCAAVKQSDSTWILEDSIIVKIIYRASQPGATGTIELASCNLGHTGESGETGEQAYLKYGFDRLLFDWSWDDVSINECDDSGNAKFCDATQFSISLSKKAVQIKKFTESSDNFTDIEAYTGKWGFDNVDFDELKDTAHLYLWTKEQMEITDSSDIPTTYLFFRNSKNEILSQYDFEVDNEENAENEESNESQPATFISVVLDLTRLEVSVGSQNEDLGDAGFDDAEIIATISDDNFDEVQMNLLGAEKDEVTGNYYMTFNEYHALVNSLFTDCSAETETCTIESITSDNDGTVELTTDLLTKIYENISFSAGIRNSGTLTVENNDELITKIMTDAKNIKGLNASDLWNNIRFDSYLLEDDYSGNGEYSDDNFREHYFYAGLYENEKHPLDYINFAEENWKSLTSLGQAGRYKLLLNYNWESDTFELSRAILHYSFTALTASQPESSFNYRANPLFFTPFNAGMHPNLVSEIILSKSVDPGAHDAVIEESQNANYYDTYSFTQEGKLFEITSDDKIYYSPSSAVKVTVEIDEGTKVPSGDGGTQTDYTNAEPKGIFYSLTPAQTTAPILYWQIESGWVSDHLNEASELTSTCSSVSGSNNYAGISGDLGSDISSIVFTPLNTPMALTFICSANEHAVSSVEFNPSGSGITTTTKLGAVSNQLLAETSRTLQLNNTEFYNYYSLEEYLNLLESGYTCLDLDNTKSEMLLYWNTRKRSSDLQPDISDPE